MLDGRLAGTQTSTDARGRFEFTGSESGSVRLETRREGFKPNTYTALWASSSGGGSQIRLESLEATGVPLDPGNYTLTFSFDLASARDLGSLPACQGFPAEAAKRTFNATVTESTDLNRFDTLVTVESPAVVAHSQLWLAIGSRSVSFGEMENAFTEQLSGFRYVNAQFGPLVPDEPVTVSGGTISVPATGFFQYCELYGPIDLQHRSEQCQHNATKEFHACVSDNVRLVFTRR